MTDPAVPGTALVISGCAVTSPFGMGLDRFAAGLDAGGPPSGTPGGPVPGFGAREVLGRKGTRAMDRATGLAVATVGMLLDGSGTDDDPEGTGLVLGTSGSVQSIMDFTRDALTGEKPFHVDPAAFPNTVMNRPAGQSAIWHTLQGPNVTVCGGAATGLLAVNYAARLVRGGHARTLITGAVEELTEQRVRLERAAAGPGGRGPLGEGAALFLLETAATARHRGRRPLAVLLGSRFRACRPNGVEDALERCVGDLLDTAGPRATGLPVVVAPGGRPGPAGKQEAAVLDRLAAKVADRVVVRPLLGDTAAASAALQIAGALSSPHAGPGRLGLITSVDRDGTVGATLLRFTGEGVRR